MLEKLEIHNVFETLARPDGGLILCRVAQPARELLNHVAYERKKAPNGAELRFVHTVRPRSNALLVVGTRTTS